MIFLFVSLNFTIGDSKDKKSRRKKIDISDTSKIRVLKVVVTLDDYLNLSESPHEFF